MWVTELQLRSGEMDVKGWLSSLDNTARPRFSKKHLSRWMHTLSANFWLYIGIYTCRAFIEILSCSNFKLQRLRSAWSTE